MSPGIRTPIRGGKIIFQKLVYKQHNLDGKIMVKTYDKKFKRKVALEAIKEDNTLAEISSKYGVTSKRISIWKKDALSHLSEALRVNQNLGKKIMRK